MINITDSSNLVPKKYIKIGSIDEHKTHYSVINAIGYVNYGFYNAFKPP